MEVGSGTPPLPWAYEGPRGCRGIDSAWGGPPHAHRGVGGRGEGCLNSNREGPHLFHGARIYVTATRSSGVDTRAMEQMWALPVRVQTPIPAPSHTPMRMGRPSPCRIDLPSALGAFIRPQEGGPDPTSIWRGPVRWRSLSVACGRSGVR